MKRIMCLLLMCILCMGMLSACTQTISVTEEQKAYAESIYQKANSVQIIDEVGFDKKLKLNSIHLTSDNGKNYLLFEYRYNTGEQGEIRNGGNVDFFISVKKYYLFTNGNISALPINDIGHTLKNKKAISMISWDSSATASEMTEKLYKITQYL